MEANANLNCIDSHQGIQSLFASAIIPIKALNQEGQIVFSNTAELTLLKYTDHEYLQQQFSNFLADKKQWNEISEILKAGQEINNRDLVCVAKDGSKINLLVSSMTKRSSTDNCVLHYLFSRDITVLTRTQELLGYLNKAGEELVSALDTETALQKISNLIVPRFANWFTIDVLKDGQIEALTLKHVDPVQMQWAEDYRKNNPTDLNDPKSGLAIALTTGQPVFVPEITDQMLVEAIDDPERLAYFRSLNLRSAITVPMIIADVITGAVTFISTENSRKYDETDLQFAKDFANRIALTLENARLYENAQNEIKQRKEAEQKKDEFISIASHELKTPLTSIKAYVQLLQKTAAADSREYSFLVKTNGHITRLERLISDLLDVSKIEAGKLMYLAEVFNFNDLLKGSVESAQNLSSHHHIKIERAVDVFLKADKLRIEQVLNNFLSNAIKYSPGADKVIVRSEILQNNLVVSVQDFGIGIERQDMGNLFDRFYRVDNTAMKFQGLGLGLYISAEIVKRHNGSFWIESEPGKGSKFFFLLPLDDQQDNNEAITDNATYYRDNHIEIQLCTEKCQVEANWIGFQNFETVKNGCLVMHKLLKASKCNKVLNDNSQVTGNWSEAVDWGGQVWFPMMERAGTKYFAWISSRSTFSQLSAEKSVETMQGKIKTRFFNDKAEAARWLDSVD